MLESSFTLGAGAALSAADIGRLLFALGAMLGLARIVGEIARRYRQPAVLGEIVAGILLGPTVLGRLHPYAFQWLFPEQGAATLALSGFVTVAVVLLLLVAGLEVDLSTVVRQSRAAMSISFMSIALPFIVGVGLAFAMPQLLGKEPQSPLVPFALMVGIALSITALPVIAKIMLDINLFNTDVGMLIMSAAMVNDLVGWIGFAVVLGMMTGGSGGVGATIALTLFFVAMMLTAARWLAHWVLPWIQAHTSWPGGVLGFVIVVGLLCAGVTESIGVHGVFGGFFAGVAIGDSPRLRQRTRDTIHQFVMNIFAPLFFASIGLHVDFIDAFNPITVGLVLVVAVAVKVAGGWLGALWGGVARREALAIGWGMSARGAMEIVLGQLALHAGLITQRLFVALVIMALVTSIMAGPLMQRALGRSPRRRLSDILSEPQVLWSLSADDARQAIRELCERAARICGLPVERIDEAVWAREQIMRTGLAQSVAVPHAALDELAKPLVVIGRSADGVDFDAPDGQPARLICLLLSPRDDPSAQVELLRMVSRAFAHEEPRALALAAQNYTQFLAALNFAESQAHE